MQIPPGKVAIYAFQATKRSVRHQNLCSLPERIVILKKDKLRERLLLSFEKYHNKWFQWTKNKSSRVLNYTFSAGSTKVRFEPQAAIKRF